MAYNKVSADMIQKWKSEINRRIYQERKIHIIEKIAKREGLSHSTVYYWTAPEKFRKKRRHYGRKYRMEHLEECLKKSREYDAQHRQEQVQYQRDRRSNPEIRAHNCAQTRLRWKVGNHIDQLLPEIVPEGNEPITTQEMVNRLWNITGGITVRVSTLEKSINKYLSHNPIPIIKEIQPSRYIRN